MTAESAARNILPGMLGDVVRIAGLPAAFALAQRYGGTQHYFPRQVRRGDPLAKLVGLKTARLLCERFGGKRHHVPAARAAMRWYETHALRRREGLSYAAIAKRVGLSKRHVIDLLHDEPAPAAVPSLPARRALTAAGRCPFCGRRHRDGTAREETDPRQLRLPL